MWIASIGYKVSVDYVYVKGDVGYGWSADGTGISYGIVLGFYLFGN